MQGRHRNGNPGVAVLSEQVEIGHPSGEDILQRMEALSDGVAPDENPRYTLAVVNIQSVPAALTRRRAFFAQTSHF